MPNKKKKVTNRKIKLTIKQKEELIKAEKRAKKPQLAKRIQGILLKNKGWTNREIAEHLGVSDSAVGRWIERYSQERSDDFLHWGYSGKKRKITTQQMELVKKRIKEKPFAIAQEAVDYIKDNFQIKYHPRYMPRLLKKIVYPTRKPV